MPSPLNNVTTKDNYDAAVTLTPQYPPSKYNLIITNAAVYAQFEMLSPEMRIGTGGFGPAEFLVPGVYSMLRTGVGFVRFRSAAVGVHAQVTARAQ